MVLTELKIPQLSQETCMEYARTILANYNFDHLSQIEGGSINPVYDGLVRRQEDILIPYEFSPYIEAGDTSGAYWIIQPRGSTPPVQIISPEYQLTAKGVKGQGWILGWHRQEGVKVWPYLKEDNCQETAVLSQGWVVCFVARSTADLFIVEGKDVPHYDLEFEKEVTDSAVVDDESGRKIICILGDFYGKLRDLKEFDDLPNRMGGR